MHPADSFSAASQFAAIQDQAVAALDNFYAAAFHAQLLQIFAVFYFVDVGEKRFFEGGS